jgi:multidrug efflux pump subunit AcrA (membrane-fusion protein)
METTTLTPPRRRPELIIRPGEQGDYVVKDPKNRTYFRLGEQETFLLECLDGTHATDDICRDFQARFNEPLGREDVDGFVELARSQNFLEDGRPERPNTLSFLQRVRHLLYWRKRILDPDPILSWLEPRLRFLFTGSFLFGSLAVILFAACVFFARRVEFIHYIPRSWEAIVMVWITIGFATALHEFAHGLTCKHFGGEVREMGFLMMFFLPCFYCDISDAWIFREKSKRLWVTLAGTYCDLCLWAIAVLVWRATLPESVPAGLASIVVTVCGVRVLFNAIPLLKLDGYYFLSDALELPNLRDRSLGRVAGHVRWLLWGAPRPEPDPRGGTLFFVGVLTWAFSFWFLVAMLFSLWYYHLHSWGPIGALGVALLGWLTIPNLFTDFSRGEIMKMFLPRPRRLIGWGLVIGAVVLALTFIPMQDKATGQFRVRPSSRAEIRAPVSGFLLTVHRGEGDAVETGTPIVQLDVPDLASKIQEKKAEIDEARAKLKLLEIGSRREIVDEQRLKVSRAKDWRDLADEDLRRKRKALDEEAIRLRENIRQHIVERDNAHENLVLSKSLFERKAIALDQLREWDKKHQIADTLVRQAEAQLRERQAVGAQEQEAELARRDKELADARSALALLEIGSRPEEIEAQRSHLARLNENLAYLEKLGAKTRVVSSIAGTITTPYLKEKIGSFFKEGELICEVEDTADLEVEIPLLEQDVGLVQIDHPVELKARALPFTPLEGRVHRIAPAVAKADKSDAATSQNTVTVYCRLSESCSELHPGMTGYARINCGTHCAGRVLATRVMRYLRTEFWW